MRIIPWMLLAHLAPFPQDLNARLLRAVELGHLELIRHSVLAGADVHMAEDKCMREASERGSEAVVRCFVGLGADVARATIGPCAGLRGNDHLPVVRFLPRTYHYMREGGGGARPRSNCAVFNWGWGRCPASSILTASITANLGLLRYLTSIVASSKRPIPQFVIDEHLRRRGNFRPHYELRRRARAPRVAYFWWVPRCFDRGRRSGRRMARRNFRAFRLASS